MTLVLLMSLLTVTPDEREALRLFEEARVAMKNQAWDVACPKLQRSRELATTLGTLVNLGVCLESSLQPRRAFVVFEEAQALARKTGDSARAAFISTHLDGLRGKLGWIEVRPDGLPLPGTLVEIGDERLDFSGSLTVLVEPGVTALRFSAEGAKARTLTVDVPAGSTLPLDIRPLEPSERSATIVVDPPPVAAPLSLSPSVPLPPSPVIERAASPAPKPAFLGGLLVSSLVTIASTVGLIWSRSTADQAVLQQMTGALTVTRGQYATAVTLYPLSIIGLITGVIGGATFGSLAFAER